MNIFKKNNNILRSLIINFIVIFMILISLTIPVTACHSVGTYESDYETPKTTFMQGEIVYGKETYHPADHLKLRIRDPSDNVVFCSDPVFSEEIKCAYQLDDYAPLGIWNIQVGLYLEGSWQWLDGCGDIAYFNVIELPKFVIYTDVVGSGTISKNPNQENYTIGTVVTLTAEPESGWKFDHWSGDLSGSSNPETITLDSDKTVTAHFVKSRVNGGNGGGGVASLPAPKPNEAPIADLSAGESYTGFINEEIEFDATFSHDNDGYITEWFWNFGDGTTALGEIATHNYSTSGVFTVILIVTDNKGASDSDMTTAVIIQPNHPPSEPNINGTIEGFVNVEYLFSIVSTDEDNDEIKYTVDWGDGNIDESEFLPNGSIFTISYKWKTVGTYTIKVTANDDQTISSSELTIIIIEEPVPEEENIVLIFLLLLALIILILSLFLIKRIKDKE